MTKIRELMIEAGVIVPFDDPEGARVATFPAPQSAPSVGLRLTARERQAAERLAARAIQRDAEVTK